MLIKHNPFLSEAVVTPEATYFKRRDFLRLAVAASAGVATTMLNSPSQADTGLEKIDFKDLPKSQFSVTDELTSYADVTQYNNFYEFGLDKSDPARYAHTLITRPWTVNVEGEVEKPATIDIETILKSFTLEERIYPLRCVEGWSMVIPWVGFPLADFLKRFQPTSKAKYVQFVTLHDPAQMPNQRSRVLEWPYVEGLRMDEAMHPLTILSVGLYGKLLPNQNGAPIRLVVPWKYGFKSIKSIVKIRLVEEQPVTSWAQAAPDEYGFYANVNPQVSHPRWSQAKERRLSGERSLLGALFGGAQKQETQLFNGYSKQVANLYADMDLKVNF